MKTKKQTITMLSLGLAGLALLATIILAGILREFSLPIQISLAIFVISIAVYGITNPDAIKKFFGGRQAKHGSNALILTLAVLGIITVINLVAYKNQVKVDLTEDKTNTLADESVEILKSFDERIEADAFFSSVSSSKASAETLLNNFKSSSNGKFNYQFIDPNEDPLAAKNAGITRDGSIVLKYNTSQEIVTSITEQEITSALIRLKTPEEKIVYSLTGHGEWGFDDNSEQSSYSYAKSELTSKNYVIKELNLLAENKIPEDATIIIIAGPVKPLSEVEVKLLDEYVLKGGSLIVLYEPSVMTEFGETEDPLNAYLLSNFGVSFVDDMVLSNEVDPPSTAVAAEYGNHPITTKLQNIVTVFPTARSIEIEEDNIFEITELIFTSDQSWSETNMQGLLNGEYGLDPEIDHSGPITIAITLSDNQSGSRVVLFGDADFASNLMYRMYANSNLFLNSVDWAANQDEIINLTAKQQTSRTIITPNLYLQNAILLGVVIIIPLAIIIAAIFIFIKRHREV